MKTTLVFTYIVAGLLVLFALVLVVQYAAAPRIIENATLSYRMMLGLSGPLVDALLSSLVGLTRTLFCMSSGLLFVLGGMTFVLARLLVYVERQSLRILALEERLSRGADVAPADRPASPQR
ncbi:MAG: hypothetical protein ACWGO1_13060 [Anaerolineales bacterium]